MKASMMRIGLNCSYISVHNGYCLSDDRQMHSEAIPRSDELYSSPESRYGKKRNRCKERETTLVTVKYQAQIIEDPRPHKD